MVTLVSFALFFSTVKVIQSLPRRNSAALGIRSTSSLDHVVYASSDAVSIPQNVLRQIDKSSLSL